MSELNQLRQQRGGHRAQSTKLSQQITTQLEEETACIDTLELLRDELSKQQSLILDLDSEILSHLTGDAVNTEISHTSDQRIKVNLTLKKVEKRLATKSTSNANTSLAKSVKLPNITLKKFSGDPLQWSSFWDMFRTSIHERSDIAVPAKFHYLISQLEGEAAKLLSGFDNNECDYLEAVNLLETTYGRKKLLIQARLSALFDLSTPSATVDGLGEFRSNYEAHLRSLKSLGSNTDEAGFVFAELLLRKLPISTRDNINRAAKSDTWDLRELREAIAMEIMHLQALTDTKHRSTSDYFMRDAVPKPPTVAFPISTAKTKSCNFCAGSHYSHECSKFGSLQSKQNRVRELTLCYNCLKPNHSVAKCNNVGRCRYCKRKHHSSLCNNQSSSTNTENRESTSYSKKKPEKVLQKSENANSTTCTVASLNNTNVHRTEVLPTAILNLVTENGDKVQCKSLFDLAAQRSFIHKDQAAKLNLKVKYSSVFSIDGFGSTGENTSHDIVQVPVVTNNGIIYIDAVVTNDMPARISMIGRSMMAKELLQNGVMLADPTTNCDVYSDLNLLVGIDNYFKFVYAPKLCDDLYGIPSNVGTLIAGTIPSNQSSNKTVTTVLKVACISDDDTNLELQNLWNLETIGISEPKCEDSQAIENFKNSVEYNDGKYTAALPWKNEHVNLPDNRNLSLKMLKSVCNSLRKNPLKLKHYANIINDQVKLGFIEEVDSNEPINDAAKIHYLPHHAVHKNSETTPIRIVFNCSSKISKDHASLNDCLLTGPCMLNDLLQVLLRFKLNNYACTADIEKAYLNIYLKECDRDSCRFFWPRDPFDENSEILIYRFKVVLFGSTASQFLLNATIDYHLKFLNDSVSHSILRNIYVDNIQSTFETESQIVDFYHKSKSIMQSAGFTLHEWNSNSQKLNSSIDHVSGTVNVLGLEWNTVSDAFSVKIPDVANNVVTKRFIVSNVAKIFDPYGQLLPVTVRGKLLVQDLWRLKVGWDEKLPESKIKEWLNYSKEILKLDKFEISRKINCKNPTLHVFADSSTKAYGAVAYFADERNVDFLTAKSRLAPIQPPTLPQLELTALNIAARLAKFIKASFEREIVIKETFLWTDSQIVVHWMRSSKAVKPYVRQRVQNINECCPDAKIMYVSGLENPADLLTRGINSNTFLKSELWLNGPNWLCNEFPPQTINIIVNFDSVQISNSLPVPVQTVCNFPIDFCRFGSYSKLLRVTAYVHRFINKLKDKIFERKIKDFKVDVKVNNIDESRSITCPSVDELKESEILLIKSSQKTFYSDILETLSSKNSAKPNKLIKQLRLKLSPEGIIVSSGRLQKADMTECSKVPILLHSKSVLAKLIIADIHRSNLHSGVNEILCLSRQKWWIPQARCKIKSILRKCVSCLKVQGKAYPEPVTPPFPFDRVNKAKPFQVTGIDYTGALEVKNCDKIVKAYIVLFTCAVTRAVHLEIVQNSSEEEFIQAFIRFCSRRSYPEIVFSDNASTFVSASKTLKEIANHFKVQNFLSKVSIKWKFITPRSPWQGAMWERLIGLAKSSLKKVLGKACISLSELQTLITQIEAKLNDRPLTYQSDDVNDLTPLTPSSLIFGYQIKEFPDPSNLEEVLDPTFHTREMLSKRQTYCNLLIQKFWKRWQSEYLTALRERYNFNSKSPEKCIKIGDVVLVHEDCPRVNWRMGLVKELIKGADDIVRTAVVKIKTGTFLRPVVKLYPLEVQSDEDLVQTKSTTLNELSPIPRLKRTAAVEALDKIKKMQSE